jgi:hypothetical protein
MVGFIMLQGSPGSRIDDPEYLKVDAGTADECIDIIHSVCSGGIACHNHCLDGLLVAEGNLCFLSGVVFTGEKEVNVLDDMLYQQAGLPSA